MLNGNIGLRFGAAHRITFVVAAVGALAALLPHGVAAQEELDEEYVASLINQALETERTGVEVPWTNPATGSNGSITIERTFYRDPRTPCRDYRRTVERPGGPSLVIQGTGCRVGSGRWSLDEEAPDPAREALFRRAPGATGTPEPPPSEPESAAVAPSCPALTAVPVPCDKPPPVVDYTMPTKTEL